MAFEVKVPQMGESVLEGTIGEWKVAAGDKVVINQPLVEIMTDKVNVEIPSPVMGTVGTVLVEPGIVVQVGQILCTIEVAGEASVAKPEKGKSQQPAPVASAAAPITSSIPSGSRERMAPAVRKLVREYGLDASRITGTGPQGRITAEDVQKAAASRSVVTGAVPSLRKEPVVSQQASAGERIEERMPLTGARKAIAEHMLRSKQTSAHVTTFEECDFTNLVDYRNQAKEQFLTTHGVKLTYMPFIMHAAVACLKEFPTLNASLTDTEIIIKKYYNIGVAVARDSGLIVPVVHDADKRSLIDIAVILDDLGRRARVDKLKLEEVQGGTFTLTNAGMFGATASTPIINQPQVAILGIHKITEKPVVRGSQIVIRNMSTFGLSFDHRLIDGHTAVQFLHRLIGYLENPLQFLLK